MAHFKRTLGCPCLLLVSLLMSQGVMAQEDDLGLSPELEAELYGLLPKWMPLYGLRTGAGYKDNVLFSDLNKQSSSFVGTSAEVFVSRLPDNYGELDIFMTYEDIRYLDSIDVDKEQLGLAQVQWKQWLQEDTRADALLNYIYQNQVLDVSVTEADLDVLKVKGHTFLGRPGIRWEMWPDTWWTEAQFQVERQWFDSPLDDYLNLTPRLILGGRYGHRSEVRLAQEFTHRSYDEDPQLDGAGLEIPGTTRAFNQLRTLVTWRHYWDAKRRWRSTSSLSWKRNEDNGGGFFNFDRYQARHELRFYDRSWDIRAEGRLAHYRYNEQTDSAGDDNRQRDEYQMGVRVERSLLKYLGVYVEYEWERTGSNASFEEYTINTVLGGLLWEF